MVHVGLSYERGVGVARDLDQARFWYQKSAQHGSADGA
jgi:TPR repeat protein